MAKKKSKSKTSSSKKDKKSKKHIDTDDDLSDLGSFDSEGSENEWLDFNDTGPKKDKKKSKKDKKSKGKKKGKGKYSDDEQDELSDILISDGSDDELPSKSSKGPKKGKTDEKLDKKKGKQSKKRALDDDDYLLDEVEPPPKRGRKSKQEIEDSPVVFASERFSRTKGNDALFDSLITNGRGKATKKSSPLPIIEDIPLGKRTPTARDQDLFKEKGRKKKVSFGSTFSDEDDDIDLDSSPPPKSKSRAKSNKPPSASRVPSRKASSRKHYEEEEDIEEDDDDIEEVFDSPKPKAIAKSKLKKATPYSKGHDIKKKGKSIEIDEMDEDEEEDVGTPIDASFDYVDSGNHLCSSCSTFFPTIEDYLEHMHSEDHWELAPDDEPWEKPSKKAAGVSPSKDQPKNFAKSIRGTQLVVPSKAFYCIACDQFMGSNTAAHIHLETWKHNFEYGKYIRKNRAYEKGWRKTVTEALNRGPVTPQKSKKSPAKASPAPKTAKAGSQSKKSAKKPFSKAKKSPPKKPIQLTSRGRPVYKPGGNSLVTERSSRYVSRASSSTQKTNRSFSRRSAREPELPYYDLSTIPGWLKTHPQLSKQVRVNIWPQERKMAEEGRVRENYHEIVKKNLRNGVDEDDISSSCADVIYNLLGQVDAELNGTQWPPLETPSKSRPSARSRASSSRAEVSPTYSSRRSSRRGASSNYENLFDKEPDANDDFESPISKNIDALLNGLDSPIQQDRASPSHPQLSDEERSPAKKVDGNALFDSLFGASSSDKKGEDDSAKHGGMETDSPLSPDVHNGNVPSNLDGEKQGEDETGENGPFKKRKTRFESYEDEPNHEGQERGDKDISGEEYHDAEDDSHQQDNSPSNEEAYDDNGDYEYRGRENDEDDEETAGNTDKDQEMYSTDDKDCQVNFESEPEQDDDERQEDDEQYDVGDPGPHVHANDHRQEPANEDPDPPYPTITMSDLNAGTYPWL